MAKSKRRGAKSAHFIVEVRDGNLVVSLPNGKFKATYYKRAGRPHLILRERTKTDDHGLLAEAFQAAVAKARELGLDYVSVNPDTHRGPRPSDRTV